MQVGDGCSHIYISWCGQKEIGWVNEQYDKVDFKPSSLDTDQIAIDLHHWMYFHKE